ncbi:hypothetical protein AWN90_19150 [Nocardia terpenica]|uniref:Uncharacterized protein n=1 Tax=Nocardia terpenica TaxID=455432 RepID=A0A164PFI1_9NOCA|nr:hypothetical protein [Nocardia terpenica]KZM75498.1 hypothetical protein AWN90_19150 [Nocardia terpenica]
MYREGRCALYFAVLPLPGEDAFADGRGQYLRGSPALRDAGPVEYSMVFELVLIGNDDEFGCGGERFG